jgi:predicted PhzF superfamily epimerase YddE/YHI9
LRRVTAPTRLTVRQGEDLGRPSELLVDVDPADERVKVTGQAVPIRQP